MTKAFEEMERIESVFSVYRPDSEICRINSSAAGGPVRVDKEAFGLIARAVEYSRATEGAFDITVKPPVDLWRDAGKKGVLPSEEEIKETLSRTGYERLILDRSAGTVLFEKEGMGLDLGGIAKGYAVERAVRVLRENGVENAVVSCGGAVYSMGRRSKNRPWKIGVQHPRQKRRIIFDIFLKDRAVDTSGDYERFFILDGRRYSHIIDPRTGMPVGDDAVSATVITGDSVAADAFATALCVLGRRGLDLVDSLEGVDAILVSRDGSRLEVAMTKGLEERYVIVRKEK
jgi:thiamine biosynthesis lipoprotein